MKNKKHVGYNYLHRHPYMEQTLNVDVDHVIIDKNEWIEVVEYFRKYPSEVKELGKKLIFG